MLSWWQLWLPNFFRVLTLLDVDSTSRGNYNGPLIEILPKKIEDLHPVHHCPIVLERQLLDL
jgi:hypothetical protein